MAANTICSDFGAQKNKVSHFFPIKIPQWMLKPVGQSLKRNRIFT